MVNPPTTSRIAERAVVCVLLCLRADAERLWERDAKRATSLHERVAMLVRGAALQEALEDDDRWLFAAPPGTLAFDDAQDASWAIESAAVLAWAVGREPALARDHLVDVQPLVDSIVASPEVARAFVAGARLRSADEIARQARETVLIRHGILKRRMPDMPDAVYARVVDRRLAELGLAASTEDQRAVTLRSLAAEMLTPTIGKLYSTRALAFEWLFGARDSFWGEEDEQE